MKNILILGIITLTALSCKAQIIPIENYINYIDAENGIPDNTTHIKDVNNLLNKFVGTWVGTYDSKSFEFQITKVTQTSYGVMEDLLVVKHKITNSSGIVLEDTINGNDTSIGISSNYLARNGAYVLIYTGTEADCGQFGDIYISVGWNNSNNNMRLGLSPGRDIVTEECPNGIATQIFPVDDGMTLVKQ